MVKRKNLEDLWYFCLTVRECVRGKVSLGSFLSQDFLRCFGIHALSTNGHFWKLLYNLYRSHKVSFILLTVTLLCSEKREAVPYRIDIINPSSDPKWHLLKLMFDLICKISEPSFDGTEKSLSNVYCQRHQHFNSLFPHRRFYQFSTYWGDIKITWYCLAHMRRRGEERGETKLIL